MLNEWIVRPGSLDDPLRVNCIFCFEDLSKMIWEFATQVIADCTHMDRHA